MVTDTDIELIFYRRRQLIMASIKLPFGKSGITAEIPDDRLAGVLRSEAGSYKAEKGESEIVQDALDEPIDSPKLSELAKGKNNIVMICSDHTRPVPSKVIAPLAIKEIRKGNPDAEITMLIATGFHRPTTHEELVNKFGEDIVNDKSIKFVVHLSGKEEDMVSIGTLPSGGELLINKVAAEADLLISEGFIEPHFFAGFSGGRKSVLPGVSSRKTVMYNHNAEFIDSPYARTGSYKKNPIHKDMLWAAKQAKLKFIINVVLDADKKVIKAFAGNLETAHEQGCAFVDKLAGVDAIPSPIAVSTNGGYPLDQNVYQSVKGMTAAEATCEPGGVIIMVSSCADGHGGQDMYNCFASGRDKEDIMDEFLATPKDRTVPDQWESQIFCRILLKYHVIMVTEAPREMVENMQMSYASSFDQALKMADAYLGKDDAKITVIPDGVSVIVRAKD